MHWLQRNQQKTIYYANFLNAHVMSGSSRAPQGARLANKDNHHALLELQHGDLRDDRQLTNLNSSFCRNLRRP